MTSQIFSHFESDTAALDRCLKRPPKSRCVRCVVVVLYLCCGVVLLCVVCVLCCVVLLCCVV